MTTNNMLLARRTFKAGILSDLALSDSVSRAEMSAADQSFLEIIRSFDIGYSTYKPPLVENDIMSSRNFEFTSFHRKRWYHVLVLFQE